MGVVCAFLATRKVVFHSKEFEYIETFYNTVRIHSHCGYLSPNEYENVYEQKLNKMERLAG